jgi:hypothetical protein
MESAGEIISQVSVLRMVITLTQNFQTACKKPNRRCKSQLVFVLMEATISPSYKQCLGKKASVPRVKC